MKSRAFIVLLLLTALASFGQQTNSTQAPAQTAPNQAPAAAAAKPAARTLQAQSQDELKAYQDDFALTDPAKLEAAANEFAAKYPNSQLRASLYGRAMSLYAQSNNTDKVIDVGRQAIAADPINPVPLVQVASALAESTRDTDLDREQRLAEAAKDAHTAIDNIDTGFLAPANLSQSVIDEAKRRILTRAYDTLGVVDLDKQDYGSAVTNLQKAIAQNPGEPDGIIYLRLSVAQDKLNQLPQAMDSANKAVQYSKDGTVAQNLAKQQQARLQKLMSAGSGSGGAAPMSPSPAPTPQPSPSPAPTSPSNPH